MVTLKNDGEKILDKNEKQESQTETVLLEEDGNTAPIVVQERYPDVEGVVVVCEGGDDAALSLHIKEAVTALFGIDAHKVVVCKLQQAYQN
jgi:stage III sporulation protein AG